MEPQVFETQTVITVKDLNPNSINELIESFKNIITSDLQEGLKLDLHGRI